MVQRLSVVLVIVLLALPAAALAVTAWESTYSLTYPGGGTALVCRDHYGTPHIYATSEGAMWYANGYATAEDRLWQLDKYRHDAKGTLAAVLGAGQVAHDQQVRLEGYTEAERQAQYDALPARYRGIMEAYRDGINARITAVLASPDTLGPKEFWDAGHTPEPWVVTDSLAIAQMMARRFGAGGGGELDNQAYVNANGLEAFNAWFPINDPTATVTIPDAEAPPRPTMPAPAKTAAKTTHDYADLDPAVIAAMAARKAEYWQNLADLGLPTKLGSFSDVVAPAKSATAQPMLLGAPQMGYTEPQIANEADLHCPGFDCGGMQFSGIPSILIGRNRDLAWTTTSGCSDNVDMVVENLNPANQYQYWHDGAWRDMDRRTETIEVAGGSPVLYEVCRTVHGPVMGWDLGSNHAFAAHCTWWNDEILSIVAFLGYDEAADLTEFQAAVAGIVTSHNFLVADKAGNIGYWHAGRFRYPGAGVDVRLPMSGDGTQEWTGFWPFEDLPQLTNPLQHYFANWNNKPVWWWDHGDDRYWIGVNHVHLIQDDMDAKPVVTFDDMKAVPQVINSKGTYEQVVTVGADLTLPAVNILPPGQSGFISKTGGYDPHFFDQKDTYYAWGYKPFQFIAPEVVAAGFAFDPVSGVQGVDPTNPLPFTVRVECRDPLGAVATGYTGPAQLSAAGFTVSPASVTCTAGVWSGQVRLYGSPAAATLTCADAYWQAQGASAAISAAGKADPNADSSVNVLDVLRTVNLALGNSVPTPPALTFQRWSADANADSGVNVLDVLQVVNRSLAPAPRAAAAAVKRARAVGVRVSLGRQGSEWLLRADNGAGIAGVQADLTCTGTPTINGPDGWSVASARVGSALRIVAYSPTATPLSAGPQVLLRLSGLSGKVRLAGVILADASGQVIRVR